MKKFTSSPSWVAYFRSNAELSALERKPEAAPLPDSLRRVIARSLPAWQLGETSDGRHLRRAARQYAEKHEDPDFMLAVELFIREEQRHGAALGDWLDRVGIPRRRSDLGDNLFRLCRYAIPHYAVWASVVVMVEAMAELYYCAVYRLTACPRLRAECRQILSDEVKHIQFQCEHLASARRHLPRGLRADLWVAEALFYTVVCSAVWLAHGRLFRASGLTLRAFATAARGKFDRLQRLTRPEAYTFDDRSPSPARDGMPAFARS